MDELLSDMESAGWPSGEIPRVQRHFDYLEGAGVRNADRLVTKLRTAGQHGDRSGFGGALAETHYAMRFSRADSRVVVEPKGRSGPDLLVRATPR